MLSLRLAAVALAAVSSIVLTASAAVVAGWTIPSAFPTNPPPTGTSYSVGAADQGVNTFGSSLSSFHVATATAYTSPSGNGNPFSFSSNNWAIGDYYEARLSTVGFTGLTLTWDQARSATGPVNFELILSVDGGVNFTSVISSYAVIQSGGGGAPGTWSTGTYLPAYSNKQVLGVEAENQSEIILRFRALSAAGAASGSNRIDSVFINGSAVPAPGAMVLLGIAGLAARRRRS